MPRQGHNSRLRLSLIFLCSVGTLAFGIYLMTLYGQLREAFTRKDTFVPVRIYSDLQRIASPDSRRAIETRLRSLAYAVSTQGSDLKFTLQSMDYPS